MATLVTGAAGFVGLNLVEHLLTAGRTVVALDRIDLPARARRDFARLSGHLVVIGGSILSSADLRRALTVAPVRTVIHAAVITAGSARERADPEGIVAVNVQGAVATLMQAARHGIARFVYPSSVAIYGRNAEGVDPIPESLAPRPVMIYGLTKLACEQLLPRIAEVQNLSFAAARLASVYGPWEYATGARDTLSPMMHALNHARAGTEATLTQPGLGDFCYSRDNAAGLVGSRRRPHPRPTHLQPRQRPSPHRRGLVPRPGHAHPRLPLAPRRPGRGSQYRKPRDLRPRRPRHRRHHPRHRLGTAIHARGGRGRLPCLGRGLIPLSHACKPTVTEP